MEAFDTHKRQKSQLAKQVEEKNCWKTARNDVANKSLPKFRCTKADRCIKAEQKKKKKKKKGKQRAQQDVINKVNVRFKKFVISKLNECFW